MAFSGHDQLRHCKAIGCLLIPQLYSKVVALELYHLSGLNLCRTSCLDPKCVDLFKACPSNRSSTLTSGLQYDSILTSSLCNLAFPISYRIILGLSLHHLSCISVSSGQDTQCSSHRSIHAVLDSVEKVSAT